jgi:hypothetical protein
MVAVAKVLGIWLLITQITFPPSLLYFILLLKTSSLFMGNEICLEMILQLSTYYLGIVYVKLATNWKALRSFNLPSCSGSVLFGTPVRPPRSLARDWGPRVARHTFLWVLSSHGNFTEDLGILGKSPRTVGRSCRWLGLHPFPSLLFYRFMYKYEVKPPPNDDPFTSWITLKTKNISEHSTFWFTPLKLASTRSVQFITPIFRLDSFTLFWTKILS